VKKGYIMNKNEFEQIFAQASMAANKAYSDATPKAMAVQNSGINEGFDWSKPYEIVQDGVCGFAWLNFPVDGRSAIAKIMKEFGAYKDYYGGLSFWSSDLMHDTTQSMQRKEAGIKAAAAVFGAHGMKCYPMSRMD